MLKTRAFLAQTSIEGSAIHRQKTRDFLRRATAVEE
jgi:hypothetical protein